MNIDELHTPQLNQNGYHRNTLTKERIGSILIYPIDFTPDDCLSCDGYSLLITDYKELFAVIGTKFNQSGDEEGTFRVPDYNISNSFLEPSTNVGVKIEAGLPNITGNVHTDYWSDIFDATIMSGAFYCNLASLMISQNANSAGMVVSDFNFDASRSNNIYGKSNTVQPKAQTVHLVIKYK